MYKCLLSLHVLQVGGQVGAALPLTPENRVRISARRTVVIDRACRGLPQSLQAHAGIYLKMGQDHFLPHPFKPIIQ